MNKHSHLFPRSTGHCFYRMALCWINSAYPSRSPPYPPQSCFVSCTADLYELHHSGYFALASGQFQPRKSLQERGVWGQGVYSLFPPCCELPDSPKKVCSSCQVAHILTIPSLVSSGLGEVRTACCCWPSWCSTTPCRFPLTPTHIFVNGLSNSPHILDLRYHFLSVGTLTTQKPLLFPLDTYHEATPPPPDIISNSTVSSWSRVDMMPPLNSCLWQWGRAHLTLLQHSSISRQSPRWLTVPISKAI